MTPRNSAMNKPCTIEGCDRRHYGRGYCMLHHRRWWKYGNPLTMRSGSPESPRQITIRDSIAYIPLTRGYTALIDAEDVHLVNNINWYAMNIHNLCYARNSEIGLLHTIVFPVPQGMEIDHINHNGLDCRKSNLRAATHAQNMHNIRKGRGSSQYKGVYRHKHRNNWYAYISVKDKVVHIAACDTEEEAAIYYNVAAQLFYGEFANLNPL